MMSKVSIYLPNALLADALVDLAKSGTLKEWLNERMEEMKLAEFQMTDHEATVWEDQNEFSPQHVIQYE